MIARALVCAAIALALASCSRKPAKSGCDLPANGLGSARPIARWKPPAGCSGAGSDVATAPTLVRSEDEFRAHFQCPAGVASGVDFGRSALVVLTRHDSPANMGDEVVDDGHAVTIVNDQRSACPGEPPPHPGPDTTLTFLVPTDAPRTFAETVCHVDYSCP